MNTVTFQFQFQNSLDLYFFYGNFLFSALYFTETSEISFKHSLIEGSIFLAKLYIKTGHFKQLRYWVTQPLRQFKPSTRWQMETLFQGVYRNYVVEKQEHWL